MALDCIIHVLGFYLKIVSENRHEVVRKTSFDKMSKTVHALFNPGRRAFPSSSNEPVYDALVDIVVMFANNKLDFAMNQVIMELLRTDNLLSESVLIGLRAFMAVADQCDVNKLSNALEEDRQLVDKYPTWVVKLLERSHRMSANGPGFGYQMSEDGAFITNGTGIGTVGGFNMSDVPSSVRISSPFSNYQSASFAGNVSAITAGMGTMSKAHNVASISFLDSMGIAPYQEIIVKLFATIIQLCENNFGNLLLTNQTKPLQELLSKDKFSGLKVFVAAIGCLPRLIPHGYTVHQVMDLLCRCVIHQHNDVRDMAWDAMDQIIEFQPSLCPTLVHCFTETLLGIDDLKNSLLEIVLSKFVLLLEKWVGTLHPSKVKQREKYKPPTIYGEYKGSINTVLNISQVETVGLVFMCNTSPSIRLLAMQVFTHVRTIATILVGGNLQDATVADVLAEIGTDIIEKTIKGSNSSSSNSTMASRDKRSSLHIVQEFVKETNTPYSEFLREVARSVSNFCPATARLVVRKISTRARKLNDRINALTDKEINLWRYFITFACAIRVREEIKSSTEQDPLTRRQSREVESPRDLYEIILPHLKNGNEKFLQPAVDALGGVHEDLLEILLEQLKPYEVDAFGDRHKKIKKRKDFLRTQLSRIYAKLSESISDSLLQEKEFIKEKFLTFIDEHKSFLGSSNYNLELQPLRYNLYTIIDNLARKLHYFSPLKGRTFDGGLRLELFNMLIRWSGFGEANKQRSTEESDYFKQVIEKLRDDEEKKRVELIYRRRNSAITVKACSAIAGLMLGKFIEKDLDKVYEWSVASRLQLKHHQPEEDELSTSQLKQKERSTPLISLLIYKAGKRESTEGDHGSSSAGKEFDYSVGVAFLKWVDEVLCSEDRTFRALGQQALENMLETNPNLLPLCVDQCYQCNTMISQGYLAAIVEVFSHAEISCDVSMLITLVMYQSFSENRDTRNNTLRLLQYISYMNFEENSPASNYPFAFSPSTLGNYSNTRQELAERLAMDHPELAIGILRQVYRRLEFISEDNQSSLLYCLVPWIVHFELDAKTDFSVHAQLKKQQQQQQPDRKSNYANAQQTLIVNSKSLTQEVLDALFDMTTTYRPVFHNQCEQLWRQLAKNPANIDVTVSYLLHRSTTFTSENAVDMFAVCQQIIVYLGTQNAKQTLHVLCTALVNVRDGTGPHKREKSPSMDRIVQQQQSTAEPITLLRADVILILLTEFAYMDAADFRPHLPLVLHYCFIRMDHRNKLISENCKLLLVHIVHSFAIKNLPHNGGTIEEREHLELANQIIQYVHGSRNKLLWKRDRITIDDQSLLVPYPTENSSQQHNNSHHTGMSKNAQIMASLVNRIVSVLRKEVDLVDRWGMEALQWATKSLSIHNVVRSYQIYCTLSPMFRASEIISIMYDIRHYMEDIVEHDEKNERVKLRVLLEMIDTLRDLVKNMDANRFILFPQLFWLSVALLRSNVVYIYIHALALLSAVIDQLDINNELVQNVIIASEPLDFNPAFNGVQRLVLRGLMNKHSEPMAIVLLSKITAMPCDFMFDTSQSRLLMNIMGLLPWLCLHIGDERYRQRTHIVASRIAQTCDVNRHKKIAKVFLRYSKDYYASQDKFLLELRKPLCEAFFPLFEREIFDLLEHLLDHGPIEYRRPILAILHSFILHIDVSKSDLNRREQLFNTIAGFVGGPLWQDATRVLDVAVRSSCRGMRDNLKLAYKNDVYIMSGPKTLDPFAVPNIKHTIQDLSKILDSMRHHSIESYEAMSDTMRTSLASFIDGFAESSGINSGMSSVVGGAGNSLLMTVDANGADGHDQALAMMPNASTIDLDNDMSMVSALDISEIDIGSDEDASEFTEDFSEVTESDLLTSFSANKYRATMDFDDSSSAEMQTFDELFKSQLRYMQPIASPYLNL